MKRTPVIWFPFIPFFYLQENSIDLLHILANIYHSPTSYLRFPVFSPSVQQALWYQFCWLIRLVLFYQSRNYCCISVRVCMLYRGGDVVFVRKCISVNSPFLYLLRECRQFCDLSAVAYKSRLIK